MHRSLIAAAFALALAACGGSDKKTANAAASATFHYGAPAGATALQASALEGSLAGAGGGTTPAAGLLFADTSSVTADLLGSTNLLPLASVASAPALSARRRGASALTASGFDNPACMTLTATTATFAGCTTTMDLSSGADTLVLVITLDGTASGNATTNTFSWDLRTATRITASGAHTVAANLSMHSSGSLTLTATTFVGHVANELGAGGTVDGLPVASGVDESLDVNVTYADAVSCPSRVTSGTLEARRVWTTRPAGHTAADLPDAAAKVTWTGCGTATIQLGTR